MKCARILRTLGIVVILSLLIAAIPVSPALAANDLAVSPTTGSIGENFTVTGTNFTPSTDTTERQARIIFAKQNVNTGSNIDINVNTYEVLGHQQVSFDTDPVPGRFSGTYAVPSILDDGTVDESVTSGTYYIYITLTLASGVGTYIYAKASFNVIGGEIEIDPEEGPVDTFVEITGEAFAADEDIEIEFDGDEIDIEDGDDETDSDGEFSAFIIIPESKAGEHDITVIVGDVEVEAVFTVEPDIIITPQSGEAGTEVTISGTGFARRPNEVFIYFHNTEIAAAAMDTNGSFTTTFLVPEGLTAGVFTIEAEDEDENLATTSFTLNVPPQPQPEPEPTPTPTPTPPPPVSQTALTVNASGDIVGSLIGIGGAGFIPNSQVTIKYDDSVVATVTADAAGLIMATFQAPPSKHGDHTITVSDGTNTDTVVFTVESIAPDIPAPLSPEMGVKAKSPLKFDWEDVIDESFPVTYVLQIATDDDFTPDSIIFEFTDIERSDYMLTEAEELKLAGREDAYYWRVQAMDAASNESGWTGAGEFYISAPFSFTGWPLYTVCAIGAILLFCIGYWLGRRTAFYY